VSRAATIGERGRRFTLQLPVETPDGFGGVLRTFQPGPLLWGAMRLVGDGERRSADRPAESVTHRVTLPWRDGIADGSQLTLGLRRFRIRSASDPDGSRREMVCLVEELRP
jgi:SPP1 family predicted phage head-tail adaptor